jgi:hypothetical protein
MIRQQGKGGRTRLVEAADLIASHLLFTSLYEQFKMPSRA